MNREIKFRAFDDGKMLSMPINTNYGISRFFGFLRQDAVVMQFTGLKDKNAKDIYEDDIVRILYTDWASKSDNDKRTLSQYLIDISHKGVVKFNQVSFEVELYSKKYNEFIFNSLNYGKHGFIEIIGNIYENPELLVDLD